jgi:hypothetical protein
LKNGAYFSKQTRHEHGMPRIAVAALPATPACMVLLQNGLVAEQKQDALFVSMGSHMAADKAIAPSFRSFCLN